MEFSIVSNSNRRLRTSRVGCCSVVHSCKHSGPIRSDACKGVRSGTHGQKERRRKKEGGQCQKHQGQMLYSVRRPCTDVLAHPHKEPLMSVLPTKDAGTNKDSIVILLLKYHPKKNKKLFGTRTVGMKQFLLITWYLIIILLHLKWYLPFHKCHHMVSIPSLCLLSSPV